jgi:hypothetical protein
MRCALIAEMEAHSVTVEEGRREGGHQTARVGEPIPKPGRSRDEKDRNAHHINRVGDDSPADGANINEY